MQFAKRQRLYRGYWGPLVTGLAIGLLLGFAGPFGSASGMPPATRYTFWVGLSGVGIACALAADAILTAGRPKSRLRRIVAVALTSSVPMTFVVAWTVTLIQPGRIYSPSQLLALFWGVAAVQLMIVYATATMQRESKKPTSSDATESLAAPYVEVPEEHRMDREVEPPSGFPQAIISKLPTEIGTEILALETEDHYLRVHATGGTALILMRMADAVALIGSDVGVQVHRRWWVSDSAVVSTSNEGQKFTLRLAGGSVVPVGRTFATTIRERFRSLPKLATCSSTDKGIKHDDARTLSIR